MATPLAVPLVSSSNFDCSQVRVPSARARTGTEIIIRAKQSFFRVGKFKPQSCKRKSRVSRKRKTRRGRENGEWAVLIFSLFFNMENTRQPIREKIDQLVNLVSIAAPG